MKRITWIAAGAVMVILVSWGMAATATEQNEQNVVKEAGQTIEVSYDYLEDYEPSMMYALDGAEVFQTADSNRKIGELEAGTPIYCYQKTDNGFYYGTTDRNHTYYVYESAVSDRPDSAAKAVMLAPAKKDEPSENSILFICSSFGELESVSIYNPANGRTVILKGMGMYDYESYDFLSAGDSTLEIVKTYTDGQVIKQDLCIKNANKQVGIYDDGSFGKSWLEIDGSFLYDEEQE